MLELVARAAAEVGVELVRIDRRGCGGLNLALAGVVVDEVDQVVPDARRARHLRALVGAAEPVLLVEQVLVDVAGVERGDLVAVGVSGEAELAADRGGRMGMRRSRGWVPIGPVTGYLRIDRGALGATACLPVEVVSRKGRRRRRSWSTAARPST